MKRILITFIIISELIDISISSLPQYTTFSANTFSDYDNWVITLGTPTSSYISICNTLNLFGGINKFSKSTTVQKSFDFSAHDYKTFRLEFYFLNNAVGTVGQLEIYQEGTGDAATDIKLYRQDVSIDASDSNPCAESSTGQYTVIYFELAHQQQVFNLKIVFSQDNWGFRNMVIEGKTGFPNPDPICDSTCAQCSGTAKSDCLTCVLPTDKQIVNSNCVCFDSLKYNDKGTCISCNETCETCTTTYCLTCKNAYYLANANQFCTQCPAPCESCKLDVNKQIVCVSCIPPYVYNVQTNDCTCPEGNYVDSNKLCLPCEYPCQTCSSKSTQCLTCITGFNWLKDTFECQPETQCEKTDYFYDVTTKSCLKCDKSCLTCSIRATRCTTCMKNVVEMNRLDKSQTEFSCPCNIGFYDNLKDVKCLPCHSTCKTCSGPADLNCYTCYEQHNRQKDLVTNQCNCVFANLNEGVHLEINPKCSCNPGYFVDSTTCSLCDDGCLECSGQSSNSCLACDKQKRKILDKVTSTCLCDHLLLRKNSQTGACEKIIESSDDGIIVIGKILVGLNGILVIPMLYLSPFAFLQIFNYFQLFRHFIFLNVEFPHASEEYLKLFEPFDLNILNRFFASKLTQMDSSPSFYKYGYDSLFLNNIQQFLLSMFILFWITVLAIIVYGIAIKKEDENKLRVFMDQVSRAFNLNVWIGFYALGYLNFTIFSMLQIKNSAVYNYVMFISYVMAIMFSVAGFIFPFYTFIKGAYFFIYQNVYRYILQRPQLRYPPHVQINQYSLFFDYFRYNHYMAHSFYPLWLFRSFAFSLLVVYVTKIPVLGIIILIFINLGILAVLVLKQPYRRQILTIRDIILETIIIILYILIAPMSDNSLSYSQFLQLSNGVVALLSIFLIVSLIGLLFEYKYAIDQLMGKTLKEDYPEDYDQTLKTQTVGDKGQQSQEGTSTALDWIVKAVGSGEDDNILKELIDFSKHDNLVVTGYQGAAQANKLEDEFQVYPNTFKAFNNGQNQTSVDHSLDEDKRLKTSEQFIDDNQNQQNAPPPQTKQ